MKPASWAPVVVALMAAAASCSDKSPGDPSRPTESCGEHCDPSILCPVSCDDGDACTTDTMTGSRETCDAACLNIVDANCSSSGGGGSGGSGEYVPSCDEATIGDNANTLAVNVADEAHPIAKEIFGVLLEILGRNVNGGIYVGTSSPIPNTRGIRDDIIAGFKEAGVGAIQWPGGCAANGYNWQANLNPSNTVGTDLFMEFSKWVDAEPFLVGRPQAQYAQSNRDWVEYVNDNAEHPDWHLKYFKVGNEVWGCGGDLGDDLATYETWYRANHDLLRPPVNGKDLFLVGATGGIWTINPNTNNWFTTMLSPGHLADQVDGVEIHDYIYFPDTVPDVGFSDAQYYDIVHRANEGQIARRIRDIRATLDARDPSGRIKIIEDEWGDWLDGSHADGWFQKGTLLDAISAAEHLHVFMEHGDRVQMAGLAQSTNVIHSLFATNSSSGGTDLVKTPTFYVFKMFLPHHVNGARWTPLTLESETITGNGQTFPVLSSAASVDDDGRVHVSLVNVDLVESRSVTIRLDSAVGGYEVARAEVLTGPAKDSFNDFGQAETVNIQALPAAEYAICGKKLEVTLPSKSVVLLTLSPL